MTWDETVLRWINTGLACLPLDILMSILTIAVIPAALGLPLIRSRQRRTQESRALICALLLALSISLVLQFLTARPRPQALRLVLPLPPFASFPSGHVVVWIGYAVLVTLTHKRIAFGEWAVALTVALSRLYLGHHYPTDILGGIILGAAVGATSYGLYYRSDRIRPRWAWLLWLNIAVVLNASLCAYLGLLQHPAIAFPGMDKVLHFFLYGGLAFGFVGWFARFATPTLLSILSAIAVVEEMSQSLSALRSFDRLDLLATISGILVFGLLGSWVRQHHRQRTSDSLEIGQASAPDPEEKPPLVPGTLG